MSETLLSIEHVSKKFCKTLKRALWYGVKDLTSELVGRKGERTDLRRNEFWAIRDLSFEVERGEVLGLIGPNGAGKTTALKLLNGLIKPDEGRISVTGRVGALIELGAGFNPILTGRENIFVSAAMLGIAKKQITEQLDEIIDFAGVREFIDMPVQSYSSGMRVRLGFSVAVNMRPDIILIDEVLAVGDLAFKNKSLDAMRKIRDSGAAIVFISHNLAQVRSLCNRAIYLKRGRMMEEGPPDTTISAYVTDSPDEPGRFTSEAGSADYILVQDVQLLDGTGQAVETAVSGYPVTLRLAFEAKQHLEAPLFHFKLTPFGSDVTAANINQQINEDRPSFFPGHHVITVDLKHFSLLAGRYQLMLTVNGPDVLTKYARGCDLGEVRVRTREGQLAESNRAGMVELGSDWAVLPQTETADVQS